LSAKGAQFLHLAYQGGRLAHLLFRQLRHWLQQEVLTQIKDVLVAK